MEISIAVADTLVGAMTVRFMDKQPRLAVSTIEDKRRAYGAWRGDDASDGRRCCGRMVRQPESLARSILWPGVVTVWGEIPGVWEILLAENDRFSTPVPNYESLFQFGSGPSGFAWRTRLAIKDDDIIQ